jgi:hypothetical protein
MHRETAARLLVQALRVATADPKAATRCSRREWLVAGARLLREQLDHEFATGRQRRTA